MKRARGWAWGAIGSLMALGGATYVSACVGDEPATFGGDQDGGGDGIAPGAVACKTTTDCTGGGSCVDGFCCDTSCDGQCQACDVSGHEGTCTAVTGKPHHEACTGDPSGACAGTCDGTNTDSCSYPDVACGTAGSCAGGTAQTAQTCSKGTCGASTSHACGLGCFQDSCLGVAQVAVGFSTTCVLLTDTSVRCWGDNTSGVTGQSMGTTITTPQIVGGLTSVKMLGASGSTMCALMGDGTVKCWGSNYYGQLGNGNNYETTTANPVPSTVSGVTGATFISSTTGQRFCAIVAGGGVKCWGFNQNGSLGYGKTEAAMGHTNQPQDVCAPGATTAPCTSLLTGATYVAGGDYHTCAVVGGKVACWGTSQNGVLGTPNDGVDHPIPAFVPGITDAATLTGSGYISCAATTGGKALCWGSNINHNAGFGDAPDAGVWSPTEICTASDCSKHPTGVTGISTYDEVSCILTGGAVQCWGKNDQGQLGDGTTTPLHTFIASSSIASGAAQVGTGAENGFAIVVDGPERRLKCWGSDLSSECGDGPDGGNGGFLRAPVEPKWQ